MKKLIAWAYLLLSVPTAFLAFLAVVGGAEGDMAGSLPVIVFLWICAPIMFLVSGIGLLRGTAWGRWCAVAISALGGLSMLIYANVAWKTMKHDGPQTLIICYVLSGIFISLLFYLVREPKK